jgi:hypothetical protein
LTVCDWVHGVTEENSDASCVCEDRALEEGAVGYVFLVLKAAQSNGEAVTVTVVRPE